MNHLAMVVAISAPLILSGCTGAGGVTTLASTPIQTTTPTTGTPTPPAPPSSPPTSPPPPTPAPTSLYISGNWQFNSTSTAGMPPAKIYGSITESGGSVSAAMHVDGSACFDSPTTIALTGTLTGSDISLTSTPVEGQVIALTGTITENADTGVLTSTGTYSITGGCGDGDKGTVTGILIYLDQALDGTFTTSQQQTFTVSGGLYYEIEPNPDGSSGLTGTAAFSTPCFSSVTIKPGTISSGSYTIGTTVGLEFDTGNGTLTFLGTVNLDSYDAEFDGYQISGNYTVSGGTCDGTGTAVLGVYNPWDY